MAEDTSGGGRGWPWMRIVLVLSLALNLLIAGVVAGALLRGPLHDPDRRPALADLGFGPFVEALPRRERIAVARDLRREAGAFRENRAELRRQFGRLVELLKAEPYDAGAVEELVARQQTKLMERQSLGRKILLQRLAEMAPAERAAYADRLAQLLRHRGPPHDRR